MRIITSTPTHDGNDELLTHRLFDLALDGDTGSAELNAIDAEVYGRLLEAYAPDPDDGHHSRARAHSPDAESRLSRTWGSANAAQIPRLPWAP